MLTEENIQIVDTYLARESVEKYAYLAMLEEITLNDFNLNIPAMSIPSKKRKST